MVASPLDTTQQQESIDAQIIRFATEKITYEPWSSRTLRTKLKDHRDIVFRYTRSAEWVEAICGPSIDNGQTSISNRGQVSMVESIVLAQLPIYSAGLSKEIADRVERIKDEYRKGKRQESYNQLLSLEVDATWSVLEVSLRARIVRQRAAYRLDCFGDPAGARILVDQAHNLDPDGDDTVIRAFITFYTEGSNDALASLGEPTNTASLNAKLAFLLELERSRDALDQIEKSRAIAHDVETRRLHALSLLAAGDVDQARTTIQVALAAEPDFEFVRFSAAVVDYFSCLAPASLPTRLVQWPEPPNWALIKSDDLSRERLWLAEQAFGILCKNTERGENWLRILETWRLACIANDSARQDEARDFCRDLLAQNPNHYRAFLWAQVRGLNVDFRSSELSLRQFAVGDADLASRLQAVTTLINFYLLVDKRSDASALLEEYRTDLESIGAQRNLKLWEIQLIMAQGQARSAIDRARKERDEDLRRNLMLIALRHEAETATNWKPYLRYLEKKYRRSKRGDYLFELCSVHAELGEWHYAAERAKELIEAVQSPAAVRLAASALWRLNKKDKCLKLLNHSARYFPARVLPGDLSRMRVDCQIATGELAEAVLDAGELLRREASTQNLVTLMQAQLSSGDLKGLAISARDLMGREDVGPDTLVRAVSWVNFEDPELAKRLWRRAVSDEFSEPTQLAALIEMGFRLGLDEETAPLFRKAQDSSAEGRGPLQSVSLEDFVVANRERDQQISELQRDYERGSFPLHILTNAFSRTLVDLLHGLPEHSSKNFDPLHQARIYIRHGGKPINRQFAQASSAWRLCLDVSGLIIAGHLGILDLVEQVFKPILISPRLITALLNQQQKLQTITPRQIQMCSAILGLIDQKRLKLARTDSDHESMNSDDLECLLETMGKVWVSDLHQARAAGGFLVAHLPLTTQILPIKPLELPTELSLLVKGWETVVHHMGTQGWISTQLVEQVKASSKSTSDLSTDVPEHTSLYLYGNVVESLQEAGALEAACEHYEVHVDGLYVDYAKRIVESGQYLGTLTSWLRQLIDRLRDGLTSRLYECITPDDLQAEEREKDPGFEDAGTTRELLGHNLPPGSVLWFDDRHINSYLRSEVAPIISINEVLAALRHRLLLTDAKYYDKLIQLRAGNYRYIPVTSEEILWHIAKAPITKGVVQETPELRILRRYIAACFLDKECLQILPPLPGSSSLPGEAPFILGTKRALDEALTLVWKSKGKTAEARANYLLRNLYTGSFGIRHLLPNTKNRGDATFLLGLEIAGMVTTGLLSLGNPLREASRARQRRFMNWYQSNVIQPRITADPETAAIAGSTISNFVIHSASKTYRTENDRHVSGLINHVLFSELPPEVKSGVDLPNDVMEWIGHKVIQTVNLGNHDVDKDDFAYAVEKLMRGESPVFIKEISADEEFELHRAFVDGEVPAIEIFSRSSSTVDEPFSRIKDEFLRIGSPYPKEREKALLENRYWFDCDQQIFESEVLGIANVEDIAQRMDQVQQWRLRSAEVYYRELKAKLARSKEFHLADLIPKSPEGLMSHFRLLREDSIGVDFATAWDQASRELIATEGLPTALDRITLFPVKVPDCLIDAITDLPNNERHPLLEAWTKRCLSPLGKLHLADLATRVGGVREEFLALARGAVSALYDEEAVGQFNVLQALLKFVHEQFNPWREVAGWSDANRLALIWAHSTRLQQIFNSLNADPQKLTRILESFTGSQSAVEVFYRDRTFVDVLHHSRFSHIVFLTHGVSAILGGHSPEIIGELDLKRRIDTTAFREDARTDLIPLLRDPQLMTNVTGSFLGGDHAEALSPIMGVETDGLSSANLQTLISSKLDSLEVDQNTLEWGTVDLVVGDRPIYPDLSVRLRKFIDSLDFLKLYEQDAVTALQAVRVATNQAVHWDDDSLRQRLEASLLGLIQLSSKDLDSVKKISLDARVGALIDAALKLSIRIDSPQVSSELFSQLLHKMLKVFPSIGDYLGPGFVNLIFQLHAAELHGMWPFLLTIRATSQKAL
jgi:tetratricopeptide (TPR) repeat protein